MIILFKRLVEKKKKIEEEEEDRIESDTEERKEKICLLHSMPIQLSLFAYNKRKDLLK
jgi:hypothetical protein